MIDYVRLLKSVKNLKDTFIITESCDDHITLGGDDDFKYLIISMEDLILRNHELEVELKQEKDKYQKLVLENKKEAKIPYIHNSKVALLDGNKKVTLLSAVCPACGHDFEHYEPETCPNCGQRIDWKSYWERESNVKNNLQ